MLSPSKICLSIFIISISNPTYADDLAIKKELDAIKKVMNDRQSRIEDSLKNIENSRLDSNDFVFNQMPHQKIKVKGTPLKCHKTYFPWPGKVDGYEYEDCIFKVNIKSKTDIQGMMAAINNRIISGWEIERSELTSQNNLHTEKVINKEKYRFKRKSKE